MSKIIDLTHPITHAMPVHAYDEPVSLTQVRTLKHDHYNDWKLSSGMHVGTHIDGPGHLTDATLRIQDMPITQFVGKGFLVDARDKELDVSLLQDMPQEDGLIVLIMTGMGKHFGSQDYFEQYPVLPMAFAQELVKRKVKMVGLDFFSPDTYPFEVHKLLFKHGILIIENLTHLERLVHATSFTVIALPLNIDADSALARVIALIE